MMPENQAKSILLAPQNWDNFTNLPLKSTTFAIFTLIFVGIPRFGLSAKNLMVSVPDPPGCFAGGFRVTMWPLFLT